MSRAFRRFAVALGVAALVTVGGCTTVQGWFKNFGSKDNVEPPTPLTDFAQSVKVDHLWTERVGKGAGSSGARISPNIVDGRVYAAGVDGTVEAIDATSGRTLWNKRLGVHHRSLFFWRKRGDSLRWSSGVAAAGDLLVVGGLDGDVYALNAGDGSERWHVSVSSEVIAMPVIAENTVVVRSNDGRLFALDAATGARRWVYEQSVPALSLRGASAPVTANGLVYAGFDTGKIVAVRLADGAVVWQQTIALGEGRTEVERLQDVDGRVVLEGNEIFAAGYRGQIASIYADAGRQAWVRDLSSYAGVAVGATAVVVADSDGNVWAFDRQSGANLWKQDALLHRWLTAPAIQGNYAVVGDLEGFVHWIALDDGKLAARERLSKKPLEGAPAVSGDTVYLEDVGGRIGAYRLR